MWVETSDELNEKYFIFTDVDWSIPKCILFSFRSGIVWILSPKRNGKDILIYYFIYPSTSFNFPLNFNLKSTWFWKEQEPCLLELCSVGMQRRAFKAQIMDKISILQYSILALFLSNYAHPCQKWRKLYHYQQAKARIDCRPNYSCEKLVEKWHWAGSGKHWRLCDQNIRSHVCTNEMKKIHIPPKLLQVLYNF